jgi:hypothetical protein
MTTNRFRLVLLHALTLTVCIRLGAQNISSAGVIGNSGEQGSTLVRFAQAPARGLGMVYDSYGTIWDRAGSGRLNRYALDGRLLGSYAIATGDGRFDRETLANGNIVLLLNGSLYRLPVDAPLGAQPVALGMSADQISFANSHGDIAVLQRSTVRVLNTNNWTLSNVIPNLNIGLIYNLAILDDGSILFANAQEVRLFKNGSEVTGGWPKNLNRPPVQYIAGFWYGFDFHGTIRRFDRQFQPAPGVVLGGGSGSFIGHVDTNEELFLGNGMAMLGNTTASVSGRYGIVSLLEWDDNKQQYQIARRLGAVTDCYGLAINDNGSVWFNVGRWNWDDPPTAPILDSIVGGGILGQTVVLNDGSFLAALQRDSAVTIVHSQFDWRAQLANGISLPPAMLNAATAYTQKDGTRVLVLADASGHTSAYPLDSKNLPQTSGAPVVIHFASPVGHLTTLAMENESVMLGAVDGAICEFALQGNTWEEVRRWNSWGTGSGDRFGSEVYITTDGSQLWVSDSTRNRVLCFDLQTKKVLGSFGQTDRPGDDLQHVSHPAAIAARHGRAVVFDRDNQRIVKLQLSGS